MKTPRHQKTASAGVSHNPQRSNSLGSYLAITTGVGVASLLNAEGAIISYDGPALTVTLGVGNIFLYWAPNAAFDGTIAGTDTNRGTDRFNFRYSGTNYIYSDKNESTIKMYLGTVGNVPLKLTVGATIDLNTNWFGNTFAYMNNPGSPWATGQDGTQGIVPFYFSPAASSGTDKYYGWADFTYNNGGGESLTLNNFAYENTPNTAISAGAIPEPSSMLLLAMGGASVLVVRRRRKSQQTEESIAS